MIFLTLLILFILYHFWVVHRLVSKIKVKRFQVMCYKSEIERERAKADQLRRDYELTRSQIVDLLDDLRAKDRQLRACQELYGKLNNKLNNKL